MLKGLLYKEKVIIRNKIMKEKNLTGKSKHLVKVADNHLLSYYQS